MMMMIIINIIYYNQMKKLLIRLNIITLIIIGVFDLVFIVLWSIDISSKSDTTRKDKIQLSIFNVVINSIALLNIILGIEGVILRKTSVLIAYTTMYRYVF